MNTSFFHEKHFEGLLEKVRERGRVNVAQRVADQVSRLFHPNSCNSNPPPSDPDAESFPELAITMQLAEQINNLVQTQCFAAQSQSKPPNNFLEKLYEHPFSLKKVTQHIRQLFQSSMAPRASDQDKDASNNEKQDSSQERAVRVLGEAKFNACDFGESATNKVFTLRIVFVPPDEGDPDADKDVRSSDVGAESTVQNSQTQDGQIKTAEEQGSDSDADGSKFNLKQKVQIVPQSSKKLSRKMSNMFCKYYIFNKVRTSSF